MFHSSAFPLSETEKHLGRVRHPGRSKSQRKLAHWQGPLHRPWAHTRPLRLLQTRPPYAAVYLAAPPAQFRDGSHLARLNPPNKAPPLQTGPSSFRTCPAPNKLYKPEMWKLSTNPKSYPSASYVHIAHERHLFRSLGPIPPLSPELRSPRHLRESPKPAPHITWELKAPCRKQVGTTLQTGGPSLSPSWRAASWCAWSTVVFFRWSQNLPNA